MSNTKEERFPELVSIRSCILDFSFNSGKKIMNFGIYFGVYLEYTE